MITGEGLKRAAMRRGLVVFGGPQVFEVQTPGGVRVGRISVDGHYTITPGICGCFRGELRRIVDDAEEII